MPEGSDPRDGEETEEKHFTRRVFLKSFLSISAILGYIDVAVREEKLLVERFGDAYREYMGITGRFLPRISRGA